MLESLAIAAAGIAVVWLIFWTIRNENVSSIGEQKGLFRMIDHEAKENRTGQGLQGQKSDAPKGGGDVS
jgi:hypothetical protein